MTLGGVYQSNCICNEGTEKENTGKKLVGIIVGFFFSPPKSYVFGVSVIRTGTNVKM